MAGQAGIWVGVAAVVVGVGGGMAVMKNGHGAAGGSTPVVAAHGASAEEVAALQDDLRAAQRSISSLEKDLDSVTRSVADARAENLRLKKSLDGLASTQAAQAAALAARPASASSEGGATLTASAAGAAPAPVVDPATGLAVPFGQATDARELEVRGVLAKVEAEKKAVERAKDEKRQMEQAKRRVADIAERLTLSSDQSEKFATAMYDRDQKQGEAWQKARDEDLPREAMRAVQEGITKEYEDKLQTVLSPAQYAELQKYRDEQQQGGPGGPGGPGGNRPGGRVPGGGRQGPG